MIRFSEMPYERPDLEKVKEEMKAITARFSGAETYAQAREAILEMDALDRHVDTASSLASIRHSIDTRDSFYDEEMKFWNEAGPELHEYTHAFTAALLNTPFRRELTEEFGEVIFLNKELAVKSFIPEMIGEMQEENKLVTEYEKLLASALIPFEGGTYTIPQMTPFKTDPDDERRLAAWKAEGQWYKDNQEQLDALYDRLVHLRDSMGRKLGYDGYIPLGYNRMFRNCYGQEDVEKFRAAVRKYLVPLADRLFRGQAERLGKSYPMSFADNILSFRSGNPCPQGTADDLVARATKFYDELSPETSEFFHTMLDGELMDLLSKEGKEGGGYCTSLPDYKVPFIFANFNGTQGDVEVLTHEAGHAFAAWMNRDRDLLSTVWPGMEACEVHSMSMEFLAWPWEEGFFGEDTEKFYYSHLAGSLKFIPYGTMVDHFQHIVFEKPDMTPAQRHAVWKDLLGIYMPWQKLDGEIPFYSEGEGWQRQHHIYSFPFYYIDYCLAQTVSLEIWAMMQEDHKKAWDHYMAYTRQGGSRTFRELLENADLKTPFDEDCLREVSEAAEKWLSSQDLSRLV